MIIYKAITKKQFAKAAEISMRTLLSWLNQFDKELQQVHQKKRDKILNPAAVKILCEHFCVELNNTTLITSIT